MKYRVTVDEAGRISIPESVLDELDLKPGDAIEIERSGEALLLRPVPETPRLTKEQGVWVLNTGEPVPASATNEVVERVALSFQTYPHREVCRGIRERDFLRKGA